MLRISIQKNQFIHNPNLNPMAHLLTTLEVNYNEKRVFYDSQMGEIINIKQLFQKIEKYDFYKECISNDNKKNCYFIKVPTQIEWDSSFFVTDHENQARTILESNMLMYSQLSSITQAGKADFSIENVVFQQEVSLRAIREVDLSIKDNVNIFDNLKILHFNGEINFSKSTLIKGMLRIESPNKTDKKEISINEGVYSQIQMEESFFTKIRLCNAKIEYGNFSKNTFKEEANFYGTTFTHCPNFSQSRFEGNVNLVNTNLAFDFKNTENQIDLTTKDNDKRLVANDFRDSFRLFKNALSKEGNVLDASNYHRVELYCKEIELDSKPQKTWRDRIDSLQLWFYRLTSDHHTDLAKIFNNVIMLIALFGIFAFGLNSFVTHDLSTSNIPQKFIFGMISKTPHLIAFLILGLLLSIGILTEILRAYKTHLKGIFLSFLWRSIPSMVLLLILCVLACESFSLLPLWLQEVIFIFGVCSSFVGIYLFLLWRESRVWIAISYIVGLGILIFKPSLLLPFVGQLFGEGLKANFSAMQSLSVVYCILMVLMLFSLQKTARKNSIIPS